MIFGFRSCDNWNFNTSNPCVYAGGNYNQNGNHGLFYWNYNSATNKNANIGGRILLSGNQLLHLRIRAKWPTAQMAAHPMVKISYQGAVEYTSAQAEALERSCS